MVQVRSWSWWWNSPFFKQQAATVYLFCSHLKGGLGLGGLAGLLAQQQQQHTGPTVSIRSPSGVTRTNHPGPLQLSTRLDPPPPPSTNNGHSSIPSIGIAPPQENHQTGIDPLSTLDANVALGGARSLDEQGLDDRAFWN